MPSGCDPEGSAPCQDRPAELQLLLAQSLVQGEALEAARMSSQGAQVRSLLQLPLVAREGGGSPPCPAQPRPAHTCVCLWPGRLIQMQMRVQKGHYSSPGPRPDPSRGRMHRSASGRLKDTGSRSPESRVA